MFPASVIRAFARLSLGAGDYNIRFGEEVYRIDFGLLANPFLR